MPSSTYTWEKVQFELSAKSGSQVFVAGTFNNWNPRASRLKDNPDSGHFKATLRVPRGTHEYKFIVNDIWILDPKNAKWATNACGSLNSMLYVS
ncbi:MAG: hypothetical protein A2X49_13355 [Lentisphaerae bacterium GWF2_52_8]|nr:MAG: hypothetical protein A2X49_13355 [Lentisphaerae bacterium GWF2_52_8]